jgi:hypothetical protein
VLPYLILQRLSSTSQSHAVPAVPNAGMLRQGFSTALGTMIRRKSLLHKAPEDFSTASGENSALDRANSRQNRMVSVVPRDASVPLQSQAHRANARLTAPVL